MRKQKLKKEYFKKRGEIPFILLSFIPLLNINNLKQNSMDTETLIKVVAMIDARVNKLYWDVLPKVSSDADALPWEYDNVSGAISELMDLSERLQIAIDADVASMETSMGM